MSVVCCVVDGTVVSPARIFKLEVYPCDQLLNLAAVDILSNSVVVHAEFDEPDPDPGPEILL